MARKRQKLSQQSQDRRNAILSVVRAYLNLDTLDEYQGWCLQQGFSTALNKSQNEVLREYGKYKHRQALAALKKFNSRRSFKANIVKLHSKELEYDDLTTEPLQAIWDGFDDTSKPDLLRDVFIFLGDKTRILNNVEYIRSVVNMVEYSKSWLRPFEQWKPVSKNVHRQFRAFVRYLFAKYEMPEFMDSAWRTYDKTVIGWYISIGEGNNIRNAKAVPIKLSKKMAHYFLQAPEYYSPWAALRWAQVHALGGNKVIADAVAETRLGREFVDNKFWKTVIQFFINNPMLDRVHYGPIVDFIFNKKYENGGANVELMDDCEVGGEQPDFSMKGRTPAALLRQVNDWHRQLGKVAHQGNEKWKTSNFAGLHFVEKAALQKDKKIWTIRELLSSKDLFVEGYMQNHCVATYDVSCSSGESSIWTMDVYKNMNSFKLLTIEVDNKKKVIVQVRGRHNRLPFVHEVDVLKRWAAKAKLTMDKYVLDEE